jgi:hypothetical protein
MITYINHLRVTNLLSSPCYSDECTSVFQPSSALSSNEDLSNVHATEHLVDVSTYFLETEDPQFPVESCFRLYPPHYKVAFAFSTFSILPLQKHALRFCLPYIAYGGEAVFPRFAYLTITDTVGEVCTPVIQQFRAGTL